MSLMVIDRQAETIPPNFEARREELDERKRSRAVFKAAYERFQELTHHWIHAQDYESWGMGGSTPALLNISDWLCDFHLAGKEILHGREERLFCLHFMMGYSIKGTMRELDLASKDSFWSLSKMIEEKVGAELYRRGLWPLKTFCNIGYFD